MRQRSTDVSAAREKADRERTDEGERRAISGGVRPITSATAPRAEYPSEASSDDTVRIDRLAESDGAVQDPDFLHSLRDRLDRVERQNRWMRYALILLVLITGYSLLESTFIDQVVVKQRVMESKELKLLDSDGSARLFVRMYSRVPVLQVLDANGKPRMSLGLRFDDTPFLDLSDKTGRTRATFEMTEDDSPALRLFDEHGKTTLRIN